jgi:hypothetical protein
MRGAGFNQSSQENHSGDGGQPDSILEQALHVYR